VVAACRAAAAAASAACCACAAAASAAAKRCARCPAATVAAVGHLSQDQEQAPIPIVGEHKTIFWVTARGQFACYGLLIELENGSLGYRKPLS